MTDWCTVVQREGNMPRGDSEPATSFFRTDEGKTLLQRLKNNDIDLQSIAFKLGKFTFVIFYTHRDVLVVVACEFVAEAR